MQKIILNLSLLITCSLASAGLAFGADWDLSIGTGYLLGDSTYQIGGHVDDVTTGPDDLHFPLSELKFPLNSAMLQAEIEKEFAANWQLAVSGKVNITEETGKMKDSDWLTPGSLDIYSESDTEMQALLLDAKLSYLFYEGQYGETSINNLKAGADVRFFYSAGVGYKHQKFDFDVSNVDEWYPSSPSVPHTIVPGPALTYEVEFCIPYIELAMEMNKSDNMFLNLNVAYAPMINARDEDHHLLRDKVNVADHDWNGDAMFVTVKGRYNFATNWFITLEVEKIRIKSEGRSDASFSGVYDHTIDHKIESDQLSGFLKLGYSF